MNFNLKELKTANAHAVETLGNHGIGTTDQLLRAGSGVDERKALAEKTGIKPEQLLELVDRADLARIKGIGPIFSDLLEQAGVDTVLELSKRVPANLHAKCVEVAANHHTQRTPRPDEVESWVAQARELKPIVTY